MTYNLKLDNSNYPTQGSSYNNRYVIHNYGESQKLPMGNWYIGNNINSIRTSWIDSIIYPREYRVNVFCS